MRGPFATPEARDKAWESGAIFPDMLVRPEGSQTMFYPLRWYWTPEEGWRARILEPSDLSGPTATDARFTDQEKDPTAVYREAQVVDPWPEDDDYEGSWALDLDALLEDVRARNRRFRERAEEKARQQRPAHEAAARLAADLLGGLGNITSDYRSEPRDDPPREPGVYVSEQDSFGGRWFGITGA